MKPKIKLKNLSIQNMETYKILILEDDFEAVSKIMAELYKLEGHFAPYDFDVTVLSSSLQVKRLINPQDKDAYDIILLDRDCKIQGSFHDLDIEKFGPEKIISIPSSIEVVTMSPSCK